MWLTSVILTWGIFGTLAADSVMIPEPAVLRFRLLFLKPGMELNEVLNTIRIRNLEPAEGLGGNLRSWSYSVKLPPEPLSPTVALQLDFDRTEDGRWVLARARLSEDGKIMASIPVNEADDRREPFLRLGPRVLSTPGFTMTKPFDPAWPRN